MTKEEIKEICGKVLEMDDDLFERMQHDRDVILNDLDISRDVLAKQLRRNINAYIHLQEARDYEKRR